MSSIQPKPFTAPTAPTASNAPTQAAAAAAPVAAPAASTAVTAPVDGMATGLATAAVPTSRISAAAQFVARNVSDTFSGLATLFSTNRPGVEGWKADNLRADVGHHLGAAGWALVRTVMPDQIVGAVLAQGFGVKLKDSLPGAIVGEVKDLVTQPIEAAKSLGEAFAALKGGPRNY